MAEVHGFAGGMSGSSTPPRTHGQRSLGIKLDVDGPRDHRLTIVGTLSGPGNHSGISLEFFAAGQSIGQARTDDNGRASATTGKLEPGPCLLEIQVAGTSIKSVRTINIPGGERKSVPDKLEARALGQDGRYVITATVTDAENRPVKDVRVEIYDAHKRIALGRTNEDGILEPEPKVRFTERWRTYTVQVPGFKSRELKLSGVRPGSPPPVPEPDEEELSPNPIRSFFRGIRKGFSTIRTRGK